MEKVCVLMSTYNGEKYLSEQIDSILNQKNVEVELIVRDDGSNDLTLEILKKYSNQNKIKYYVGENLKPAHSFMNLLINAPISKYYAFADQDDWWNEEKLYNAINLIKDTDADNQKEIIYFSKVEIVDKNLEHISYLEKDKKNTLAASFLDSPAIGCTMIINDNMRKKIIEKDTTNLEIGLHDSWIYRVGLATNSNIIYDKNAYIKYRQHESNVIGAKRSKGIINNFKSLINKRKKVNSYIAENLLKLYSNEMNQENIRVLTKLSKLANTKSIKNKISIILDKNYKSYNKKANIKFVYDVLMNRM